jgi:hypothetical protein
MVEGDTTQSASAAARLRTPSSCSILAAIGRLASRPDAFTPCAISVIIALSASRSEHARIADASWRFAFSNVFSLVGSPWRARRRQGGGLLFVELDDQEPAAVWSQLVSHASDHLGERRSTTWFRSARLRNRSMACMTSFTWDSGNGTTTGERAMTNAERPATTPHASATRMAMKPTIRLGSARCALASQRRGSGDEARRRRQVPRSRTRKSRRWRSLRRPRREG